MNVRRLAQCYRCRRLFSPRGDERYCPDCAAEYRRRGLLGDSRWGSWRPLAVVLGGAGLLVLLQGGEVVPTLVALALVAAWYVYCRR